MSLETRIDARLWNVIRTHIEARNYKSAVVDAIHCLTDVIRERSGLDGDGLALVGQAFGGTSPKLKVNRLQTESDQNEQRGVEQLMRGLYQGIRNPRSHEQRQDTEQDAFALIVFVDYLLRIVDQSKTPFVLSTFIGRVLDKHFVPQARYSELLVADIPKGKHVTVFREVYTRRGEADCTKITFFLHALVQKMSEEDLAEIASVISDTLRVSDDDEAIRFVVQCLPDDFWPRLDEVARLRAENKIIRSVEVGKYTADGYCSAGGVLGTWISNILPHLSLKQELIRVVAVKIRSDVEGQRDYVFDCITHYLDDHFDKPPGLIQMKILEGLHAGDPLCRDQVEKWQGNRESDHPWVKPFVQALAKFTPAQFVESPDLPF